MFGLSESNMWICWIAKITLKQTIKLKDEIIGSIFILQLPKLLYPFVLKLPSISSYKKRNAFKINFDIEILLNFYWTIFFSHLFVTLYNFRAQFQLGFDIFRKITSEVIKYQWHRYIMYNIYSISRANLVNGGSTSKGCSMLVQLQHPEMGSSFEDDENTFLYPTMTRFE